MIPNRTLDVEKRELFRSNRMTEKRGMMEKIGENINEEVGYKNNLGQKQTETDTEITTTALVIL